ncbi:MAG: hypothetical protein ACM3PS_16065 [Syntrophothermus sp.]
MTAQIHDSFLFEDRKLSIAGVNGGELFHPAEHGMQPMPRITSCWRGHVCTYNIQDNHLVLHTLQVNLDQQGPAINNVRPVFSTGSTFNNDYQALGLLMDFTGGLLVAEGFIQQLYVHMGFHPARKYETVLELSFSKGEVLEIRDVSRQMAELRHKRTQQSQQPGREASGQEVNVWIASTYERSYRF